MSWLKAVPNRRIAESMPTCSDKCQASTFGGRGKRLWQDGYFDRVLRDEDATLTVVSYIVLNPVKAGLCRATSDYPLLGSSRYELSELLTATEWNPLG
jgi:hypothetical protein